MARSQPLRAQSSATTHNATPRCWAGRNCANGVATTASTWDTAGTGLDLDHLQQTGSGQTVSLPEMASVGSPVRTRNAQHFCVTSPSQSALGEGLG
jgi:hypothetical protein